MTIILTVCEGAPVRGLLLLQSVSCVTQMCGKTNLATSHLADLYAIYILNLETGSLPPKNRVIEFNKARHNKKSLFNCNNAITIIINIKTVYSTVYFRVQVLLYSFCVCSTKGESTVTVLDFTISVYMAVHVILSFFDSCSILFFLFLGLPSSCLGDSSK